jgi:hypothetical protein
MGLFEPLEQVERDRTLAVQARGESDVRRILQPERLATEVLGRCGHSRIGHSGPGQRRCQNGASISVGYASVGRQQGEIRSGCQVPLLIRRTRASDDRRGVEVTEVLGRLRYHPRILP